MQSDQEQIVNELSCCACRSQMSDHASIGKASGPCMQKRGAAFSVGAHISYLHLQRASKGHAAGCQQQPTSGLLMGVACSEDATKTELYGRAQENTQCLAQTLKQAS